MNNALTFLFRKKLFVALPLLKQLDGQDITREERLQAGCAAVYVFSDVITFCYELLGLVRILF